MNNIRNFAIVAHIDHGKSTLADRFLEITGTVQKGKHEEQFLDQNPISRERGITIKLAPVRMQYIHNSELYILNLIDTPGHIDFSYEVSRTLAACEGVILLVDATQGVQAQTVAHFQSAKKLDLKMIPVINKIDLPAARLEKTENELTELFGLSEDEVLKISAKTGENVQALLNAVVEKIPPPISSIPDIFRALIFDAVYDDHRGVIAFVRVFDGKIEKSEKIKFFQSKTSPLVSDVGYFTPSLISSKELLSGEIGFIVTGIKDIKKVRVGDTITKLEVKSQSGFAQAKVEPLPGYQTPQPMVFFGVYPKVQNEYVKLKEALNKLVLNDASLTISEEYSSFLGSGFRVGFLGLLHAEIVKERLRKEENIEPLLTRPQVLYKNEGKITLEPYVEVTIYSRKAYVGAIITLCEKRRGKLADISYPSGNAVLKYEMPYSIFIRGFANELKSASSGFASIDYEFTGYKEGNFTTLKILVNDNLIDVLSEVVYRDEVLQVGRQKVEKLKELLPRQQFRQVIQAKIGGDIIARSEIPPFRKDVTRGLSGGDRSRKDKLLRKQKKGKEKLLESSRIEIPQKALFSLVEN